jgi:putative protease
LEEATIEIGQVTHFFSRINVAIVELTLPLSIGNRILIKGPLTEFVQIVTSMQIDHKEIKRAQGGQSIGLKAIQKARKKDIVYKKL